MSLAPDPVILDVSPEGVAVLTLNRPAQKNALDAVALDALGDALETLKGADHVRIVFLRGAHQYFCAGIDFDVLRDLAARPREDAETFGVSALRVLQALHDLPRFTVALIEGQAAGLGVGLAAACDWVVICADASARVFDVRQGLAPALIAPFLESAIGARAARGLMLSASVADAETALRIGLAHEIANGKEALEGVLKRMSGLALEAAPGAIAATKELSVDRFDQSALRKAARAFAASLVSDEAREGLAALKEQRAPEWDR